MSKFFIGAAASIALLGMAPAYAQAPDDEDGAEQADPNEEVCKRTSQTGSRIKRRLCMSRAAWKMLEDESQKTAEKIIQEGNRNFVAD